VELGMVGSGEQETGSTPVPVDASGQAEAGAVQSKATPNVSEELDNWDENAEDWDDGDGDIGDVSSGVVEGDGGDVKKRVD